MEVKSVARRGHYSRFIRLVIAIALLSTSFVFTQPTGVAAKGEGPRHTIVPGQVAPPSIPTKPLIDPKQPRGPRVLTNATSRAVLPQLQGIHSLDPIDMAVLVITADGKETDYPAILANLDQLGIPYNVFFADRYTLDADSLWDGVSHGYYQGIILTTGTLLYESSPGIWESALSAAEWQILWEYEAMFSVRQLTSYTYPSADFGLTYVSYQDTLVAPLNATLTISGQQVFSYLVPTATIPIKGAWVYFGSIISPSVTTPLIVVPNGSGGTYPIGSITKYADGRENLAITAANNPYLLHSLLFSYGLINWVTKGLFVGERHVYMSPQVDDLLIDSDIWDTVNLTDTTGLTYRMTGNDFKAAIAWQNQIRAGSAATAYITTCVTIQPAAAAGTDTYIDSARTTTNYGVTNRIATRSSLLVKHRSLIKFDITSVPSQTKVISAVLSLNVVSNSGAQSTVEVHRLTRDWVEGNGGSNSGATWNRYNGTQNWTTAGGDYDASIAGSFTVNSTGWKNVTLTPLVQTWVSRTVANQGVILLSPNSNTLSNNGKFYHSSDASTANASLRPKLVICYLAPTSVPGLGNAGAVTLEWAFNAEGANEASPVGDTLSPTVVLSQTAFKYVSHTFSHPSLDAPFTYAELMNELTLNHNSAVNQFHFTNYYRNAMVQPDISGLYNSEAQLAAKDFGMTSWIADTSRTGWNNPTPNSGFYAQYAPSILVIPRRPSNLFYNLATPAQFVSEYNCYYGATGTCLNGAWRFWDHDLSYAEILDKESEVWLQYMLKWDMDPLMFHQANVAAYDGVHSLLGDLIQATLTKYNTYYNLPIRSDAQYVIETRMRQRMAFNDAWVTGVLKPCTSMTLVAEQAALVPVTGVITGTNTEIYGGQKISYIQLQANTPVTVPVTCP